MKFENLTEFVPAPKQSTSYNKKPANLCTLGVKERPEGTSKAQLARAVINRLAEEEIREATIWATGFDEGWIRDILLAESLELWVAQDLANASDYAKSVAEMLGDNAIRRVALAIAKKDRIYGLNWVNSLPTRERQLAKSFLNDFDTEGP